jgi:hypothetical protein
MRTTDALDQLYNPTADFLISQYPWVSSLEMTAPSAGGSTFGGGGGGGGVVSNVPIIPPSLPIVQTPKVNIKLNGLANGFISYGNKSYYDNSTIELNPLTTMDLVNLKPEGADYSEYYTISFEDVKIETPAKDVITTPTLGGVTSGGGGRRGGPVYTGGQYNPGAPGFNSNLTERPIDQIAQK